MVFFDEMAFAVAPSVLDRLSACFEASTASGYLWITGKVIEQFAGRSAEMDRAASSAFERENAISSKKTKPRRIATHARSATEAR
jgi:transportin-3